MYRNKQNDGFVGDELTWCVENGILPNTSYTLKGNYTNKVYSQSEIGIIFSNLLDQLFESKIFLEQFKKEVVFQVPIEDIKKEAQKDSNITEALYKDIESVGYIGVSVFDLFYSLISDILLIMEFKEHNLKNVVENEFKNKLITKREYVSLKVFRIFVFKVLKNAVNNLENNKNNLIKINGKWTKGVYVDTELVNLMNYGSPSAIYNRIRFILTLNKTNFKRPGVEYTRGFYIAKSSLMVVLDKLSLSRQIVFTRLLNYLSKLIDTDEISLCSRLVVKTEYNLNNLIWNLVYSAVEESGVKRLCYDDHMLIKYLYKLKPKGINVFRLFRILVYNGESYVGNQDDYECLKTNVNKQKYFNDIKYYYDDSSLANLVYMSKGISLFESKTYEI